MNLPIQIALDMLRRNTIIASQQSGKNDGDNPSEPVSGIAVALTVFLIIGVFSVTMKAHDIFVELRSWKKQVSYQVSNNVAEIGESNIDFSKVYASGTIKSDSDTGTYLSGPVNKR